MFTKRAIVRRQGENYPPIGHPGPCYILCVCGRELDLPFPHKPEDGDDRLACECGIQYDQRGWILN